MKYWENKVMKKPAIFLDRDGTINEEMGYINHETRFVLIPGTLQAIKIINDLDYYAIIITNQAGLARGYFKPDLLERIHSCFLKTVEEAGAKIDGLYFCPHHPDGIVEEFSIKCNCRKPAPGMIEQAIKDFEIDLENSYMIGDRYKDIKFGKKFNLKTIMVLTGYGIGEWEYDRDTWEVIPDHVAENLLAAVNWIKSQHK